MTARSISPLPTQAAICITILRNQSSATYFMLTGPVDASGWPTLPVRGYRHQCCGSNNQELLWEPPTFSATILPLILPADLTLANGVGVVTATFNTLGAQYLRATDTSNSKITGTSADFSVAAAPVPDHFVFSGAPNSSVAGTSFNVTVTAYDSSSHVLSGFPGQVHFSSTDAHAVLPPDYAFTSADHGTHTFSVTLTTAGIQALTVALVGNAALRGTQNGITVQAGALSQLALTAQTNTTCGRGGFCRHGVLRRTHTA